MSHTYGGMVCTINGTTITVDTNTAFEYSSRKLVSLSAVALSENKVFIAYGSSNYSSLYGIVCTINGTTITAGTRKTISSADIITLTISAVLLNENKVFIAYADDYNNQYFCLYGIICTISGTTITAGTGKTISPTAYSGVGMSAVKLSENKVFIAHKYNSSDFLYGIVCTINGTDIVIGTDTLLNATSDSGEYISAVALSENKVFIAHHMTDSTPYISGMVCTINGTAITVGTDTQLVTRGMTLSTVLLSENKVFIARSYESNGILSGILCTINGTVIAIEINTDLIVDNSTKPGYAASAVLLSENKIFIAHGYSYVYGMLNNYNNGLYTTTNSNDKITGIAKQSGTSGQTVQVYVPNV